MKYDNANILNVYKINPEIKDLISKIKIKEDVTDSNGNLIEIIKGLKKGMFLYGIAGSGKTYTLYAIRKALKSWDIDCGDIENWVELLFEIRDRYSNNLSIKSTINYITEKNFIFIDDIGAENQTQNSQELLYLILDRANRYEKILFISTNLSLEDFSKKYGDRLMSRIAELCIPYEMKEEDLRLSK